jgi:hypothetical protein
MGQRNPGDEMAARRPRDGQGPKVAGIYWFLVALFIVSLTVALVFKDNEHVDRFLPNLTSEVLGIIITLAFVHRLLQRQERARRMRGSIGAFRRAGRAVSRLVIVWADILKGCHPDEDPPRQLDRLFAPHNTEHLGQLDLRQRRADSESRWVQWLLDELDAAMTELNRIVVAYGGSLDPAYTEAVDELIDDPFIQLVRDLVAAGVEPQVWRMKMNTNRGHREDYFRHLLATVALHDRLAAEAATVRSRDRAPRTGALGMELPRDHDLKVMVRFDREWRAAPPQAGSLRIVRAAAAGPARDERSG